MTSLNYDIKDKLGRLNIIEKIIVANVIIFILTSLLSYLSINLNWLKLPSEFIDFILRPWTILTYAFLHN